MSITEELRDWVNERFVGLFSFEWVRDLNAIADRIDAEHEAACAEAYGNGVMSVPIALDESQWVKLPVDADGVPIHVGDVMEFSRFDVSYNPAVNVDGIGAGVFFSFDKKLGRFTQKDANAYRHVQPDSWERIIHDAFVESQEHFGSADAVAELVERCRRLAHDGR